MSKIKPVYSDAELEKRFKTDVKFQVEIVDILKKYLTERAEHREQIRILEGQFENLNKFVKSAMLEAGIDELNGLQLAKYLNGYYLKESE